MMKNLYAFVILAACALPARAETAAADTVSTELKEVVVKSDRAWIEGDKIVFIPTKREKNLSNSPASLIDRMNLPTVYVEGESIISRVSGKTVTVFINGIRADGTDISTFWPKQAKRVEYMEDPEDPRFEGCSSVINFIMPEYEVGGVTRIGAYQDIPNTGDYTAASKLVFRKMTYGLNFKGGYSRDHRSSSWGEDNYNGISYDGAYYDNVKREYEGHSWSRKDRFSVSFDSRYVSEKLTVKHNFGLLWNRNPGSGSHDAETWAPSLFSSEAAASENSGRSVSPQLLGQYVYKFNRKWSLWSWWQYAYSHNDSHSMYRNGELDPILNSTEDELHTAKIGLYPSYRISPKLTLYLDASSSMSWYKTRYAGSANDEVEQRRGYTAAMLVVHWRQSDNLSFTVRPGLLTTYWNVDRTGWCNKVEPVGYMSAWWTINPKLSLSANVSYSADVPTASQSGDVTVRQSQLVWLQGNPSLNTSSDWATSLYLTWMPADWLDFGLNGVYTRNDNEILSVYYAADPSMGGIVRKYVNGSPSDKYYVSINGSARLFDGRLRLHIEPYYTYTKTRGQYAGTLSWFRMAGNAEYYFANCSFNVYYGSPRKALTYGGMTESWSSGEWDVSFTYGNGNIHLTLSLDDVFNAYSKNWTQLRGDVFTSMKQGLSTGRKFSISLSYTFDYGKKVDRKIDIDSPQELESGALGI